MKALFQPKKWLKSQWNLRASIISDLIYFVLAWKSFFMWQWKFFATISYHSWHKSLSISTIMILIIPAVAFGSHGIKWMQILEVVLRCCEQIVEDERTLIQMRMKLNMLTKCGCSKLDVLVFWWSSRIANGNLNKLEFFFGKLACNVRWENWIIKYWI